MEPNYILPVWWYTWRGLRCGPDCSAFMAPICDVGIWLAQRGMVRAQVRPKFAGSCKRLQKTSVHCLELHQIPLSIRRADPDQHPVQLGGRCRGGACRTRSGGAFQLDGRQWNESCRCQLHPTSTGPPVAQEAEAHASTNRIHPGGDIGIHCASQCPQRCMRRGAPCPA